MSKVKMPYKHAIFLAVFAIAGTVMGETYQMTETQLSDPTYVISPSGFPVTFSGTLKKTRLGTASSLYTSINFIAPASGSYKTSFLSEQIAGFAACDYAVKVTIESPAQGVGVVYSGNSATLTFNKGVRYTVLITSYFRSGMPFANTEYSFDLTIGDDTSGGGTSGGGTSGGGTSGGDDSPGGEFIVAKLLSISISGNSSMSSSGSATYACMAEMDDGRTINVTPSWSISSGGSYAYITSEGRLVANNTTYSDQTVVVAAKYTFNGITRSATKTVTIGAVQRNECVVTFNAMGGSGSLGAFAFDLDTGAYLPKCTLVKGGYVFAGWAERPNGKKVWNDQQWINVGNKTTSVVLYAIWLVPGSYGIAFDPGVENATWSMDYQSVWPGEVAKLNPCALVRPSGKRFKGWRRADGRRYDDGVMVFNLAEPGEVVTLVAIWE